jgi:hypothetical protein
MKASIKLFVALCGALLLVACARGPEFNGLTLPKEGKAIVYVYRPFIYEGSASGFTLLANNREVTDSLRSSGYIFFDVDPGPVEVITDVGGVIDEPAKFTAETGKTYFVRVTFQTGAFVSTIYNHTVDEATGLREISDCHLSM